MTRTNAILLSALLLSGCAAIPQKRDIEELRSAIKPGELYDLAYYIGQRLPYKSGQQGWLSGDTCLKIGWGDCKCKAAVACDVIKSWEGWGAWYKYPNPHHVVCAFYRRSDGQLGYIDDNFVVFETYWRE